MTPTSGEEAMRALVELRAAHRLDEEHDAICCATELGRRAWGLRQDARRAAARGDLGTAAAGFRQAVALLEGEPDSVGLAAALHDLAKVLLEEHHAGPVAANAVVGMLERVVASPARRRFPQRWASSASLLASHLRSLATADNDGASRQSTFDRVEELFLSAIDAAESCCDWPSAAGYWLNLGNLRMHRDDHARAIEACERGLECARPFAGEFAARGDPTFDRVARTLGRLLLQRQRTGDLARGRSLLRLVSKSPTPEGALALLDLAELYLDRGNRTRAAGFIDAVDLGLLPVPGLDHALALFARLGMETRGIEQLEQLVGEYFHRRAATVADHDADRVTHRLQLVAGVVARLHLRRGQPLEAFLVRENVAGLRLNEATARNLVSLTDPLSRGLQARWELHGNTAAALDETLGRLPVTRPDTWRATLAATVRAYDELDTALQPWAPTAAQALRETLARDSLDLQPAIACRERAYARAARARAHLIHRQGGPLATDREVSVVEVRRVLEEHPGALLLQVARGEGRVMDAIAVRLVGGEVTMRQAAIPYPDGLFPALARVERERPTATLAHELTTMLAQLDLSSVLGDDRHALVVLLPSSSMARLPLAAIGPAGARVLDRCDAVVWLPNLLALYSRQVPRPPRTGQVTAVPGIHGGTCWHALAMARDLPGERRLSGKAATREAVLELATSADVVSFYGHGIHVDALQGLTVEDLDFGPSMRLADGDQLTLQDLQEAWRGMERVELWGCQTGVHKYIDPLGTPIDEAFGFDFEFLRVGARSAIGSLYVVPEVPTAVIVADYRRRLGEGAAPPRALADAQRQWITERLPELLGRFRDEPATALARLAAAHGIALGPRDPKGVDLADCEAIWSCPAFWASFRFVGVANRRPLEPWDPETVRPLTEAEERQLDAWVEADPETSTPSERAQVMPQSRAHVMCLPLAPPARVLSFAPCREAAMALFVPGIPCPLCHRPMGSDDDVVLFPPFMADDADPLHRFSDATVHAACLARHPLGDEARRWSDEAVQAGGRPYRCAACGEPIHDPDDYFGFGLLTRDPASPLYPYNFVHVHQQHVESWSRFPALLAVVHTVESAGEWRGPRLSYAPDAPAKLQWQRPVRGDTKEPMSSTDPTTVDSRRAAPDRPRTLCFPWEQTDHEAQDLFWRMGRGQDLLTEIHDELAALPDDERRQLLAHAMPPESWLLWAAEWYAYPSTDDDQVADALAVVMAAAGTADARGPGKGSRSG